MYLYELYKYDPGLAVLYFLFSIVLTLVAYGTFPLLFSKIRQAPITAKKFKTVCFWVNFMVWMLFAVNNGEASSGAAFLLWTTVFTRDGVLRLEKRDILEGIQPTSKRTKHHPHMTSSQKKEAIKVNAPFIDSANENPSLGHSAQTPFFFSVAPSRAARCLGELLSTTDGRRLLFTKKATYLVGPAGAIGGLCAVYEARTTSNKPYGEIVVNVMCSRTTQCPPQGFAFIPTSPYLPPISEQQPPSIKDTDSTNRAVPPISDAQSASNVPATACAEECQEPIVVEDVPSSEVHAHKNERVVHCTTGCHNKVAPNGRRFILISTVSDDPATAETSVETKSILAGAETDLPAEQEPATFCRKCGIKLLPDSFFCHICGTRIISMEASSAGGPSTPPPPVASPVEKSTDLSPIEASTPLPTISRKGHRTWRTRKSTKRILIVLLIFAALVSATFCLWKPIKTMVAYDVSIDGSSAISLIVGESQTITYTLSSQHPLTDIEWRTSKPTVAVISSSGSVTAIGVGRARISICVDGVKMDSVTVVVSKQDVTFSFTQNPDLMYLNERFKLKYTMSTNGGKTPQIYYVSEDPSIASVDSIGMVRAIKPGTTTLSAYINDELKDTITITVVKKG